MKIGAFDFIQKPFEIEEMELRIDKALEHRRLKHEIDYLRHTQPDIYDFDRIVGASGALQRVLNIVRKVAQSNTTVLIRGETGTGKRADCVGDSPQLGSGKSELCPCQLRRASRKLAGVRTIRPREGGVHRRRPTARGALRADRRGQSVPRRSRRHECQHAGQDTPCAAGT